MPKSYKRMVLGPGMYNVNTPDGKRKVVELTKERLKHWADTVKSMNESGLLIPVPYEHDLNAKPSSRREEFANVGGFWGDAIYDDETGKLTAIIESATDKDDEIISKKVRGLSIYTEPEYVDPNGNKWVDAPLHLALTNKPMAVLSKEDAEWEESESPFAICMSDMVGKDPVEDITSLRQMLEKVAKVAIPEDTTPQTLMQNLMSALMQKELSEREDDEEGSTSVPPKNSEDEFGPVLMAENDMTKELEEKNRLLAEQIKSLEDQNKALQSQLLSQRRDGLSKRVEALMMSEVTKTPAESLQASLKVEQSNLDLIEGQVAMLEAIKIPNQPKKDASSVLMSDGSQIDGDELHNPLLDSADVSPEREQAILDEVLTNLY